MPKRERTSSRLERTNVVPNQGRRWTVPGVAKPDFGEQQASAAVRGPLLSSFRMHQRNLLDFLGAVEEKRPPLVSGEDGRRAVRLIESLYAASASGGPVTL